MLEITVNNSEKSDNDRLLDSLATGDVVCPFSNYSCRCFLESKTFFRAISFCRSCHRLVMTLPKIFNHAY